jgi:serine protease DegQ
VGDGSTGERAGLQAGDVLTTLNDKPLHNVQELNNAEGLLPLGSTLRLGVLREGKLVQISATLAAEKLASVDGSALDPRLAGVRFSDLSQDQRNQGWYGVAVTTVQPGSRAARAGLAADDVVIGVGSLRITSLHVLRGLAGVKPRQLVLVVTNDGGTRYVVIN